MKSNLQNMLTLITTVYFNVLAQIFCELKGNLVQLLIDNYVIHRGEYIFHGRSFVPMQSKYCEYSLWILTENQFHDQQQANVIQ